MTLVPLLSSSDILPLNGDPTATQLINAATEDTNNNNIRSRFNQLVSALGSVVRDDGSLQSSIVTLRTLALEVATIVASQGWQPKAACNAATAGSALPSYTVDGTFTILTATVNGAFPAVDGVTLTVGQSLLVKDEATQANNGIYTLTQVGNGSTPWILTRRSDTNSANGLGLAAVTILAGSVNVNSSWVCTEQSAAIILGTTAITFVQFGSPGGIQSIANGGTGTSQPAQWPTASRLMARVAATSNVTLSAPGATIDGVTLAVGDRVLLTGQSTTSQNGLWSFQGSASPMVRTADYATGNGAQAYQDMQVAVREGAASGGSIWRLSTGGAITIDTTGTAWIQIGAQLRATSIAQLRTLVAQCDRQLCALSGYTSANDGGGGLFYWDAASTTGDDGGSAIQVTGVVTGRWKRLLPGGAVSVRWFGAVGDGFNDDTAAIQQAIGYSVNNGQSTYFPAGGTLYSFYRITSPIAVNGDCHIFGDRGNGGFQVDTVIAADGVTNDHFQISANTARVENIVFRANAGRGGTITAVGASTITFSQLAGTQLSTIAATPLVASTTQVQFCQYYTNAGNVYRSRNTSITTVGATLPSFGSGTQTVGGVTWDFVNSGTTFTAGQFGWNQQWYYFGTSGGNTLTGVVPAPGNLNHVPSDYSPSSAGGSGYFSSIEEFSTTTRTCAALNFLTSQDPTVSGCWFNLLAGRAITRGSNPGMQGGTWFNNIVDGAQYGFYGDFTFARIFGNLFYGCQKAGIYITACSKGFISTNAFNSCGIDIVVNEPTYNGLSPVGVIDGLKITDNQSVNASQNFLNATGGCQMMVGGNHIHRPGQHAMRLSTCGYSSIVCNRICGAGELAASGQFYNYISIGGTSRYLSIARNDFAYENSLQAVQYAIAYDSGSEGGATYNRLVDNVFSLNPGANPVNLPSTPSTFNGNLQMVGGHTISGATRAISNITLIPGVHEQCLLFTGNLGANTTITLDRTAAQAGDLFWISIAVGTNSFTLTIKESSDSTVLYSNAIAGVARAELLCVFDGSVWNIHILRQRSAAMTPFTDNTGGTVSSTLAAITAGAAYAQADMVACKNAIASLNAQINNLYNLLKAVDITQ